MLTDSSPRWRQALRHAVDERLDADEAALRLLARLPRSYARRHQNRSREGRRSGDCGNSVADIGWRRLAEIDRELRKQLVHQRRLAAGAAHAPCGARKTRRAEHACQRQKWTWRPSMPRWTVLRCSSTGSPDRAPDFLCEVHLLPGEPAILVGGAAEVPVGGGPPIDRAIELQCAANIGRGEAEHLR